MSIIVRVDGGSGPASSATILINQGVPPGAVMVSQPFKINGPDSWGSIPDKPPVIAAGATQQDARDAIGLGTAATADAGDFDAAGTAYSAVATHEAKADPHPQYTTSAEAAAAAPVQSVAGRTGNVTIAAGDIAGLGSAATMPASSFATAAQGGKADTALQPNAGLAAIDSAANTKLGGIAAGATANATDSQLRDRGTHTGTQPVSSIAGFNAAAASAAPVQSVAGKTGAVTLNKSDVGLSNVDNTSDANKPLSSAAITALNGKINKPASAMAGSLAMFADSTGSNVLSSTSVGSTRYFIPNIDVRNEYPVPYDGVLPNSGSRTEFKNLNQNSPGIYNPVTKDAPGLVSAVPTPLGNYANITTLSPWNDPSGGMPTQLCYANNGLFIRRGVTGWGVGQSPVNNSWTASTVTSLNDIRHATAQNRTYFFFKCTTAGTTGTTEPVWPTTDGGTVVDGTVVWTAYAYWTPWKVLATSDYTSTTDLPANAYVDNTGNISRSTAVTGRRVAVPTSSSSAGVIGDWSSDANYLYVCHATNTWRRTAVSSF